MVLSTDEPTAKSWLGHMNHWLWNMWPHCATSTHYGLCLGVLASRVEIKGSAAGGTATVPDRTISLTEISRPYTWRLSPLSGRIVEPSRETPLNRPLALDSLRIAARRAASDAANPARP